MGMPSWGSARALHGGRTDNVVGVSGDTRGVSSKAGGGADRELGTNRADSHLADDAVREGADGEVKEQDPEEHEDGLRPLGARVVLGGEGHDAEDEQAGVSGDLTSRRTAR